MKAIACGRTEPRGDARRLALYFGKLVVVYGVALLAFRDAPAKEARFAGLLVAARLSLQAVLMVLSLLAARRVLSTPAALAD